MSSPKPEAPWLPYRGQYEKKFYDVETDMGGTWLECWPNAGDWFTPGGTVVFGNVVRFRVSAYGND